jgi:hypothetical protein
MAELWRHMLELSIELEKLDEAGNYRGERHAAPRRGMPQRQHQAGPQARPVIEHRNHLDRILDVIPGPPQEYRPSRPNLPARQEIVPRPRPNYPPHISRLPARQEEYIGRGYTRQVTEIDVLPPARDWRPRPIQALPAPERKTGEWRNYMMASCIGAVLGIGGYTYLSQGGGDKVQAAKAVARPIAVANAAQPSVAADDAFHERLSNQLFRADAPGPAQGAGMSYANQMDRGNLPGAGAGYGAAAQPAGGAPPEWASNQPPPREVPRAPAPYTIPQRSDDELLAQAFYKLNHGDVPGARAAYETVAEHGSSLGAFGLAETYDPNVLARRRTLGLKPDAGLARLWYERAAQLGSAEATLRLKKLTKPAKAAALPKPVPSPKPSSQSQAVSSGSEVLRAR